jgi:hypothetical protein
MNRGAKAGILGTCGAALLVVGGLGAYNLAHGMTGGSGPSPTAQSTTPPSDAVAVKTAQAFLAGWAAGPGQYAAAAGDTDSPSLAQTDLTAFRSGLKLSSLAVTKVAATGASATEPGATQVGFTVTAQVAGGSWSYPGTLDVVQDNAGRASVNWSPSVLYSKLASGDTVAIGSVPAPASSVTVLASDGRTRLTAATYPSLAQIIASISQSGATSAGSTGQGIEILNAAGAPVTTVKVLSSGSPATVTTTIDAGLQAAAEKAVQDPVLGGKPDGVVALDRRNGHILAIAYANSGNEGDLAINGDLSPGSTMKIITSAALFDVAKLTPTSPAPCTPTIVAHGQQFGNDDDIVANSGTDIEQAFAESCNTAFIKDGFDDLVLKQPDASALHNEADNVFGLGSWDIGGGVQTSDPNVPAAPVGSNDAADLIGQGQVEMTPLILASLSATVRDGAFNQPIILPKQAQTPAAQSMNPTTDGYLQQMMDFDAHNSMGTASARLEGIPDSGGKTGTSQVGTSTITTNGWFTGYDDNISVAALVQGGTSGVGTAGYIVQSLLEDD